MKGVFIVLTLLIFTTVFADGPCKKCDLGMVKTVDEHLDSLTLQIVSDFLCTFDSSCSTNVEYSEWSNETLFDVLDKAPTIFFQVITKGQVNTEVLLKEIESPIHDLIDIQKTYDKLKIASAPKEIKTKYLNALIIAADQGGQKIKK